MNAVKYLSVAALLVLISCRPPVPVPKPIGYYRIELPEHAYQQFEGKGFPYAFSYPVYGQITQDSALVEKEKEPFWINIFFPDLDATIYLSYKAISDKEPFDDLIEESYRLSFAHDIRADYIKTPQFETAKGLLGVFYEVGGNAASAYQFFISDTLRHFVRGSLYFNVTPNADSLRPTAEFLKQDIMHLIETFEFKEVEK